jgi:hypothetical protein
MFLAICAVLTMPGCAGRSQPPVVGPTAPPGTPTGAPTPTPAPTSATLGAFVKIMSSDPGPAAGEVTGPEQLDRYRVQPPAADQELRRAIEQYRRPGVRLLLFRFTGCPSKGPTLVIEPDRVHAVLVDELPECYVAEQHLALFAVPADLIRPGARIG